MSATTIISVGELRVEFVSHATGCGLSELAAYSGPYPGGAAAISLDQAARMGAQTKIFGGIGEDGFGCALVERLAESGVDTSGLIRRCKPQSHCPCQQHCGRVGGQGCAGASFN